MRIEDAKIILDYAADIPKKLRAIAEEQAEIEAELSCLRGIEYSGMTGILNPMYAVMM